MNLVQKILLRACMSTTTEREASALADRLSKMADRHNDHRWVADVDYYSMLTWCRSIDLEDEVAG
jgi:hypothetical protein